VLLGPGNPIAPPIEGLTYYPIKLPTHIYPVKIPYCSLLESVHTNFIKFYKVYKITDCYLLCNFKRGQKSAKFDSNFDPTRLRSALFFV